MSPSVLRLTTRVCLHDCIFYWGGPGEASISWLHCNWLLAASHDVATSCLGLQTTTSGCTLTAHAACAANRVRLLSGCYALHNRCPASELPDTVHTRASELQATRRTITLRPFAFHLRLASQHLSIAPCRESFRTNSKMASTDETVAGQANAQDSSSENDYINVDEVISVPPQQIIQRDE